MKEMRLAGICDMEAANAFLPGFVARHNARFAKVPARPDDRHRPLNAPPDRLADILCLREQRHVTNQLAFTHQRQRIMLEETEITQCLAGKYVDTYAFPDGRYEVRHMGVPLAYRVFDKDQRVACGVVTGRKELGAVLAHIQKLQAALPAKPARPVPVNKQATQYQPTGRRNDGWNSKLARRQKTRQAAEAVARAADHGPDP